VFRKRKKFRSDCRSQSGKKGKGKKRPWEEGRGNLKQSNVWEGGKEGKLRVGYHQTGVKGKRSVRE